MFRSARTRALLGLVLGGALAAGGALALGVRPHELVARVRGAPLALLVGCAASSYVLALLQALRWYLVMPRLPGLGYGRALRAQLVGTTVNAVVPARAGDVLRIEYVARKTGASRATILGTELVDRWLDWWGWVPPLVVLHALCDLPRWAPGVVVAFVALLAALGGAMLFAERRVRTLSPSSRLGAALAGFRVGIAAFSSPRMIAIALIIAPLPWLWEASVIDLAAGAFGFDIPFSTAFLLLVGLNVATVLPAPGGLGAVETSGAAALALAGVAHEDAMAFVFVYHMTQLVPQSVAGIGILVAESVARGGAGLPSRDEELTAPRPSNQRATLMEHPLE
jgi:glycosyltransferase 2 family protein